MNPTPSAENQASMFRPILWRSIAAVIVLGGALLSEWMNRRPWTPSYSLESLRSGFLAVMRSAETQWEIVACLMVYFIGFQWLRSTVRSGDRSWIPRSVLISVFVTLATVVYIRDYPSSVSDQDYLALFASITVAQGLALWIAFDEKTGRDGLISRVALRAFVLWVAALALIHPSWATSFEYREQTRWSGIWRTPNLYGVLMASGVAASTGCLFASLLRSRRCPSLLWFVTLIVAGVGLVFSMSRGAWLGTLLAFVYLAARVIPLFRNALPAWIPTRRSAVQVAIIMISSYVIGYWTLRFSEQPLVRRVFTVINPNDFSWRNRVATIPGSLQMMSERPALGFGWTQPERIYTSLYKPDFMTEGAAITQNDYLMVGITCGIPALCCLLGWICLSFRGSRGRAPDRGTITSEELTRLGAKAAVIPLLIGCVFDGVLFSVAIAVPFFCFLEIAASRSTAREGDSSRSNPAP
jgi:hypothetical protein